MTTVTIGDNTGDDYSGTEDTELTEVSPDTNSGSATTYQNGQYANQRYITISFSGISNLPSSLTVSSATFYIYVSNTNAACATRLRRLLRNWVEAQATWNSWSTGNSWTTAGALSDGNDRSATTTLDITTSGSAAVWESGSSAQLATDIENFASGAVSNYGWLYSRQDEGTTTSDYILCVSSEGTDGNRPYLSVTYTTGGGTTIIQLAGGGGLAGSSGLAGPGGLAG